MQQEQKNLNKKQLSLQKTQQFHLSYQLSYIQNHEIDIELLYVQFQQMLSTEPGSSQEESQTISQQKKQPNKKTLKQSKQQIRTFQINRMQIYTPNKIPYKVLLTKIPRLSNESCITSQQFIEDIIIILKYTHSWKVTKITCIDKPQLKILNLIQNIKFSELKELNLQNNNITSIEVLQNIDMPKMESLLLHNNFITFSKVFKKLTVQSDVFKDLIINSNFIKQFNDFSRIRLRKLNTIRLQFPVPFYLQRPNRPQVVQCEDLAFIVKVQPLVSFLRIHHKQRQKQSKIQNKIYQKHWDIYIGRSV